MECSGSEIHVTGDATQARKTLEKNQGGFDLLQYCRGDRSRPKRGVFVLRSPRRPRPMRVTTVELVGVAGNVMRVRGLDAIDGTPVPDLKPG